MRTTLLLLILLVPSVAHAQDTTRRSTPDSLRLSTLHREAARIDPRQRQRSLHTTATDLRLRNLAVERLPALSMVAYGQYQSEVIEPFFAPPGTPAIPHQTYDVSLFARQALLDPTIGARRTVERAQLDEALAQVGATAFADRLELNEAFFNAAALRERIATIDAALGDLTARLREASQRLAVGAALPGDTASLAATVLQRQQDRLRLDAERTAALARLSTLAGRPIRDADVLVVPDLRDEARAVADSIDGVRRRPEYAQFDAARARLAIQERAASAYLMPKVSAFGRLGYGRPGLNPLSEQFDTYWLAGLEVRWTPWNWGTVGRERELLRVQSEIVTSNEEAFALALRRNLEQSRAAIARLETMLALDDRVVALRQTVEREAAAKLRESAITAAEYVDRNTDLLEARVARILHRVELARARATFLTLLGVELS
jgi:outer membrane protein TolC